MKKERQSEMQGKVTKFCVYEEVAGVKLTFSQGQQK